MADVHVVEDHHTTPEDAITKVGGFEDMLQKYMVRVQWRGKSADLKGPGVKGSIEVDDDKVAVRLKLGMIARAAGVDAERLSASIRKRLRSAFGDGEDG